jgi:hypothetical protein
MALEELQAMSDEELSVLAGIKVMGWSREDIYNANGHGPFRGDGGAGPWYPADDMNDAMELADKVIEIGANFDLTYNDYYQKNFDHKGWVARFPRGVDYPNSHKDIWSDSPTRAITIASILAK